MLNPTNALDKIILDPTRVIDNTCLDPYYAIFKIRDSTRDQPKKM
jgi:hypothetical protein